MSKWVRTLQICKFSGIEIKEIFRSENEGPIKELYLKGE